ncbi:hypothetical protein D3Y57_03320 (plasmid) [Sphingomonas paeninsulae]|jgi:hypothetical protein|uniref:Uncharacterized protein n=1 Tax=Sphingomonas paeninsulae TaxID=2319844 RepID=A0A494T846_SPHPE|nr:hypothetical protein [Sphingomonas paeninsulae]AYJ85080.1 hypothetical protein D3Y57_03320 [Sphingomonas paeninsulae]
MASDSLLDEIRLMARADHAYRLPRTDNPYAAGDPRAAAWTEGWQAEDDRVHRLDEEIVKLPRFRVLIEIVSGSEVLVALDREELANYRVSNLNGVDARSVTYESDEARARFPDRDNVLIRVTNEDDGGMFD